MYALKQNDGVWKYPGFCVPPSPCSYNVRMCVWVLIETRYLNTNGVKNASTFSKSMHSRAKTRPCLYRVLEIYDSEIINNQEHKL